MLGSLKAMIFGKKKKSQLEIQTLFGFMKVWLVILSDQIITKRRKNIVLLAIILFVRDMSADDSFLQRELYYQHGGGVCLCNLNMAHSLVCSHWHTHSGQRGTKVEGVTK